MFLTTERGRENLRRPKSRGRSMGITSEEKMGGEGEEVWTVMIETKEAFPST